MPRKTRAEIRQEVADALARRHHVQMKVPGGKWVYVTPSGTGTFSPAFAQDFGSREAVDRYLDQIRDPRSSVEYRYATSKK